MNIRKKTQIHRYSEQTTMYKINKLQGYIVQHRDYSQ